MLTKQYSGISLTYFSYTENMDVHITASGDMSNNIYLRYNQNTYLFRISAVFDSLYLIYYVGDFGYIETFIRPHEPLWYRVTYPYLLGPIKWMFFTCTIYMVVAISAERHRAICSPLTHRPTFWPYVLLVLCISGKFVSRNFFLGTFIGKSW